MKAVHIISCIVLEFAVRTRSARMRLVDFLVVHQILHFIKQFHQPHFFYKFDAARYNILKTNHIYVVFKLFYYSQTSY